MKQKAICECIASINKGEEYFATKKKLKNYLLLFYLDWSVDKADVASFFSSNIDVDRFVFRDRQNKR